MPKRAKNGKKPGIDELLDDDEIFDRFKELKRFFEHNWGRIGLELQGVRNPAKVTPILKSIPGIEWWQSFREHEPLGCLLKYESAIGGRAEITSREVSITRKQFKEADDAQHKLSSEFYPAQKKADEVTVALNVLKSQGGDLAVGEAADKLRVAELVAHANRLNAEFQEAQKRCRELRDKLLVESAWYARAEIVKFVLSERHSASPTSFAKAMAGMPEYGWVHSLRRCTKMKDKLNTRVEYPYQLFQLVAELTRKMKTFDLSKLENELRDALLANNADPLLRAYVSPHWRYMKRVLSDFHGNDFRPFEWPYKIIGKFMEYAEKPKTLVEVELAKLEELK